MLKFLLTPQMKKRLRQAGCLVFLLSLITAQAATIFWHEPVEAGAAAALSANDETPREAAEAIAEADLTLDATRVDGSLEMLDWSTLAAVSTALTDVPLEPVVARLTGGDSVLDGDAAAPVSLQERIYGLGEATPFHGLPLEFSPDALAGEPFAQDVPADGAATGEAPAPGLMGAPVPEPTSAVLMMCGLAAFAFARRRSS
jgi:hypothetical protein